MSIANPLFEDILVAHFPGLARAQEEYEPAEPEDEFEEYEEDQYDDLRRTELRDML